MFYVFQKRKTFLQMVSNIYGIYYDFLWVIYAFSSTPNNNGLFIQYILSSSTCKKILIAIFSMILEELKIPRLKWLATLAWYISGYQVRTLDYGDRSYAIRKCQDEPACKSLTYFTNGVGYLKTIDMTTRPLVKGTASYEHFQPYYEG